jgi:hypothetical protein
VKEVKLRVFTVKEAHVAFLYCPLLFNVCDFNATEIFSESRRDYGGGAAWAKRIYIYRA